MHIHNLQCIINIQNKQPKSYCTVAILPKYCIKSQGNSLNSEVKTKSTSPG